jgi:hypothetical protein
MPEGLDLWAAFEATSVASVGRAVMSRRHLAGTLSTPTGSIVACDPLGGIEREPFALGVAPGHYPVELLLAADADDTRVALARVLFSAERPSSWCLATWGDRDPRALRPGQVFGYGVDAGTGCFADAGAGAAFDAGAREALLAGLQASYADTWCSASWRGGGGSLVAFSSGYGDGVYASWWGLDAAGRPGCLVTDFEIIDLTLPGLPDDPAFRAAHVAATAARLLELLPALSADPWGPARSPAYSAAAELDAMRDDAATTLPRLLEALEAAPDKYVADVLLFAIKPVARASAASRAVLTAWLRERRGSAWAARLLGP